METSYTDDDAAADDDDDWRGAATAAGLKWRSGCSGDSIK